MESTLDSELAWRDFVADVFGTNNSDVNCQRYIRLNPDLKSHVPSIDAKKDLKSLQTRTIDELSSSANKRLIRSIAHRLIASSFYFEKMTPKEIHASESFVCSGMLVCCIACPPTYLFFRRTTPMPFRNEHYRSTRTWTLPQRKTRARFPTTLLDPRWWRQVRASSMYSFSTHSSSILLARILKSCIACPNNANFLGNYHARKAQYYD
jgi:hypothetical protein